MATSLRERNSKFEPVVLCLKNTDHVSHTLFMTEGLDKYIPFNMKNDNFLILVYGRQMIALYMKIKYIHAVSREKSTSSLDTQIISIITIWQSRVQSLLQKFWNELVLPRSHLQLLSQTIWNNYWRKTVNNNDNYYYHHHHQLTSVELRQPEIF